MCTSFILIFSFLTWISLSVCFFFALLQLLKNYWLGQTGLFLEMVSSFHWVNLEDRFTFFNKYQFFCSILLSLDLIVHIYQFYDCAQTCLAQFPWLDHGFSPKRGYCLKEKCRYLGHPLIRIGIWLFRNPGDRSTVFTLELVIYKSLTKEWAKKNGTENFNNDVNEAVNDLIRSKCWTKVRYAWWIC